MDKFVKLLFGGMACFLHNGQISSFKNIDVMNMVSLNGDGLTVSSSGIELGTIDVDKILFLDDADVSKLVYNFIEYALLRKEVHRLKKKK